MNKRSILTLLILFCLVFVNTSDAFAFVFQDYGADGPFVDPVSIDLTIPAGTGVTQTITVRLGETPIPSLDVLFLFDVTGSMGDVINTAKERGIEIMNTVRETVPDTAFAVASFADYPDFYATSGYSKNYGQEGDYPWRLDQDITADIDLAQNAINRLELCDGKDFPESYSRALFESIFINWRIGSKKVIILFGDAVAHDPDFYSENYGVDPGPDAELDSGDELDYEGTIDDLREYLIEVIPINSDLDGNLDVIKGFDYLATQTGGESFSISDASEAPQTVIDGLEESVSRIGLLTAELSPEAPEGWVNFVNSSFSDVEGGDEVVFEFEIKVPADYEKRNSEFNILIKGDGAELFEIPVHITVGLDAESLFNDKQELINFLSDPSGEVEFFGIPFDCGLLSGYESEEAQVQNYLDQINLDSISPSTLLALNSLVGQENSLKIFWTTHVKLSEIISKNFANIFLVGWDAVNLYDKFLKRPDILNKGMRGLTTKVMKKVREKIVSAIFNFADLLLSTIPDQESPGTKTIKEIVLGSQIIIKESIGKGMGLDEIITEGVIQFSGMTIMNTAFINNTGAEISEGLQNAERMELREIREEEANRLASELDVNINAINNEVTSEAERIIDTSESVEIAQDISKVIADTADIATLLSAAGGVTAAVGAVTKGLAIFMRLLDIGASSYLIYDSSVLWKELPEYTQRVTEQAFPLEVLSAYPAVRCYGAYDQFEKLENLSTERQTNSFNQAAILSARRVSGKLMQADADFQAVLQQLKAAIESGDKTLTEELIEEVLLADEDLTFLFQEIKAPVMAVAADEELALNSEWREMYTDFSRGSSDYSLTGAIFYANLLGYMLEPEDEELKTALLASINELAAAAAEAVEANEVILPVAAEYIPGPVAAITEIIIPEDLLIGEDFNIEILLSNPLSLTSERVEVELVTDSGLEPVDDSIWVVEDLTGSQKLSHSFSLKILESVGSGYFNVKVENGSSQSYIFLVETIETAAGEKRSPSNGISAAHSDSGAGIGFLLVMIVFVISGVFIFTLDKRKRWVTFQKGGKRSKAWIRFTSGFWQGKRFPVGQDGFVIGSQGTCDLQITDSGVFPQHARLRYANQTWFIQQLNPQALIYVNNKPLNAGRLQHGDKVLIGQTSFVFQEK